MARVDIAGPDNDGRPTDWRNLALSEKLYKTVFLDLSIVVMRDFDISSYVRDVN